MFYVAALVCRTTFALVGWKGKVPEMFTRTGFAGRLKPFRFTNAHAKARLKRPFACEF